MNVSYNSDTYYHKDYSKNETSCSMDKVHLNSICSISSVGLSYSWQSRASTLTGTALYFTYETKQACMTLDMSV